MPSVADADALMAKAEKGLTKFRLFSGGTAKFDEAQEIFQQAANYYKANQEWEKAAGAYERCREMAQKAKDDLASTNYLMDSANMYRQSNPEKANEVLQAVLQEYDNSGRSGRSAKLAQEIAEGYEKNKNVPLAIEWFEKASVYHSNENSNSLANTCKLKVVDMYAVQEQYDEALANLESVAEGYLEDNLMRTQTKNLYFKAMIIRFAKGGSADELRDKLESYQDMDSGFSNNLREVKLIGALITAVEETDLSQWQEAVDDYDSISELDDLKNKLILRAKSRLRNPDLA